jgi:hypothetical protein
MKEMNYLLKMNWGLCIDTARLKYCYFPAARYSRGLVQIARTGYEILEDFLHFLQSSEEEINSLEDMWEVKMKLAKQRVLQNFR